MLSAGLVYQFSQELVSTLLASICPFDSGADEDTARTRRIPVTALPPHGRRLVLLQGRADDFTSNLGEYGAQQFPDSAGGWLQPSASDDDPFLGDACWSPTLTVSRSPPRLHLAPLPLYIVLPFLAAMTNLHMLRFMSPLLFFRSHIGYIVSIDIDISASPSFLPFVLILLVNVQPPSRLPALLCSVSHFFFPPLSPSMPSSPSRLLPSLLRYPFTRVMRIRALSTVVPPFPSSTYHLPASSLKLSPLFAFSSFSPPLSLPISSSTSTSPNGPSDIPSTAPPLHLRLPRRPPDAPILQMPLPSPIPTLFSWPGNTTATVTIPRTCKCWSEATTQTSCAPRLNHAGLDVVSSLSFRFANVVSPRRPSILYDPASVPADYGFLLYSAHTYTHTTLATASSPSLSATTFLLIRTFFSHAQSTYITYT
ncbi:hypothetical protein R3P38DRAFT_3594066 [Favolaschia claudopus]|uniref:Uncharacterized protein n=1 Tax=Favolaschia claudopus TaxID=2862362 RepID=A0AAW0DJ83_9AGAR